ncbi:MAG: hypothetical protein WCC87_03430 [Candidatus Korobacteraceae bacterium]
MKTQTTYTKATTLGPFLSLILLSSARRGRAASEKLRSSTSEVPAVACDRLVAREEAFNESKPASRPPLNVGPMLTLILTVGRSQPQAGGS